MSFYAGSAKPATTESKPPQLMELSLQNRLRIIGWQLDSQASANASLMEVAGGILVRVCTADHPVPSIIEFKDEDFPRLVSESIARRGKRRQPIVHSDLIPTGYEDFLRALGYELDQMVAENVVITEFVSFVTVTGVGPVIEDGSTIYRTFSHALNSSGIQKLLDAAVARRNTYAPVTTYIPDNERVP